MPEELLIQPPAKREEPRVAFGSLVEGGHFTPGMTLFDAKRRYSAVVRPDGQIAADGIIGSIHKIGALVQGLPACNGWTFWHFEQAGKLEPIDAIRTQIRKQDKAA